jgi:hypothetical protein
MNVLTSSAGKGTLRDCTGRPKCNIPEQAGTVVLENRLFSYTVSSDSRQLALTEKLRSDHAAVKERLAQLTKELAKGTANIGDAMEVDHRGMRPRLQELFDQQKTTRQRILELQSAPKLAGSVEGDTCNLPAGQLTKISFFAGPVKWCPAEEEKEKEVDMMTEGDPHYQAMMAIVSDPSNDLMHEYTNHFNQHVVNTIESLGVVRAHWMYGEERFGQRWARTTAK